MTTYNVNDLFVGADGNVSKIIEVERKNKVVTLEHWDGVTSRMQYSTLRKHYTPYVEQEVAEVAEVEQEQEVAEEIIPEKKERKARQPKRTFEELVADIPIIMNGLRFVRSPKGGVIVKLGNKRVFRYTGNSLIATTEARFAGCEYKKSANAFVVKNPDKEIMLKVFRNM